MAQYDQLVNKGGTIYNTAANVAYSTPDALAADLGISANQIQWGNIKSDPNYNPQSVSTSQLQPAQPIQVPTPNTNGTISQAGALNTGVENTNKSLQDYIKQATPAPTALDTQYSDLLKSFADLTAQDTGKQAYQLQQENAFGAPELKQQISDLNSQILTGLAEQRKQLADFQATNQALEQNPQQMAAVVGTKQQELQRTFATEQASKSADLGLLQARQAALGGQLNTALDLAKRAVDMKYQPIEDQLQVKQAQLAAIQPLLDKQEKIQAAALEMKYKADQQALDDRKAKETEIHTIALQAASNGATKGIMEMITKAPDTNTALQIATPYLAKVQTQTVDVNGHTLLIDSTTGKTLQDLGTSNSYLQSQIAHSGSGSGSGSTDTALTALLASRGNDGFVDPQVYLQQRAASKLKASDFDSKFASYLSPQEQKNLGISGGVSSYQTETNQRIAQSVSELIPLVNNKTVGVLAKSTYRIPGTPAYNFNAQLQTLKSNIAFGALTQMREASKTGGALGQVSDKESSLLESTLGALDIGQSPAQFTAQLQKIQDSINRWNQAASGGSSNTSSSGGDYASYLKAIGQ